MWMKRGVVMMILLLSLLFLLFLQWIHLILPIRLFFVLVLLLSTHLLPCLAHDSRHRSSFRGHAIIMLFQFKDMFREEDIVSRFVAFSVKLLWSSVVCSFFLESVFIRFCHFIVPRLLLRTQQTPRMPTTRNITRGWYPLQLCPTIGIPQSFLVFLCQPCKSLPYKQIITRQLFAGCRFILSFAFVGLFSLRNEATEFRHFIDEKFIVFDLTIEFGFEGKFKFGGGRGVGDDGFVALGVGIFFRGDEADGAVVVLFLAFGFG
mmetsp:Transcript_35647/g.75107  ORF Transcript_35647/g.75107 Transcript_35647/m.75107 type:complete len:262 (-) Transcript_35647:527-1312(-)